MGIANDVIRSERDAQGLNMLDLAILQQRAQRGRS